MVGWSSGRRSGGCTSCAGLSSARSIAGRGCIATRSGGRSAATSRRVYRGAPAGSKLDPFKDEIHRLLNDDPKLPGVRVRELLEPLGCTVSRRSSTTTCARSGRCSRRRRTFQRTVYRPGEICQFDLWEPRDEVPVGHGQTRRGWVVIACLGYSRAGAGALIFSKQTEDLLAGIRRLPVGAGRAAADAGLGSPVGPARPRRPADRGVRRRSAAQLKVGWHFCEPRRPAGQGRRRAPAGLRGDATSSPAACSPTSSTSRIQLDAWFGDAPTRARTRRCAPGRSIGSPRSTR